LQRVGVDEGEVGLALAALGEHVEAEVGGDDERAGVGQATRGRAGSGRQVEDPLPRARVDAAFQRRDATCTLAARPS
jgi:hypothetical protein